jgi:hypothetical protein
VDRNEDAALDAGIMALAILKQSADALRASLEQHDKVNPEIRAVFQDRLKLEGLEEFARQLGLWKEEA